MSKESLAKANAQKYYPIRVSELIHERYSPDSETALINNFLADPEEYGDEYRTYQAYRAECKVRAKEELGIE